MMKRNTVLLVESEATARERFRVALERAGFAVLVASGGLAALDWIDQRTPDVIVLDLDVPDVGGAVLLEQLARDRRSRDVPIVVLTDIDWQLRVTPHAILFKPVTPQALLAAVTLAIHKWDC